MEQHNHLHGLLGSSTIIIGDRLLNSSSGWLGWCEKLVVAKEQHKHLLNSSARVKWMWVVESFGRWVG